MAQTVRQNTPEAQNATITSVTVATQNQVPPPIDDDIIMMSPFQVDSTREKGYFAENTLAGSRMRTNIADLGAAISVVTKQQLEDTASLDVNDIFRYEIGTEGK
jgi:outer membrane receptor protein involved in Fe transport